MREKVQREMYNRTVNNCRCGVTVAQRIANPSNIGECCPSSSLGVDAVNKARYFKRLRKEKGNETRRRKNFITTSSIRVRCL